MLFLTEILGAEVVDVRQRSAGRVRDLSVRVEQPYPVVTGLVVSRRGPQVIPWESVRSFAAATREVALRTAREEVERAPAHPEDVWLRRDVLDQQIVDTDGRRVVRVNDLQLAEIGSQLVLVGADIGIRGILRRLAIEGLAKWGARILRRDLPMALVSWDVVDPLGAAPEHRPGDDAVRLRISEGRIAKLHPADIADIVEELGSRDREAVFESLSEEIAADTLEEMEHEDQVAVIQQMDTGRAVEILDEMPPDVVADILGELTEDRSVEILHRLDRDEAEDVEELLAYPEDTAGGLMTTEVLQVPETATARRCLDLVREQRSDTAVAFYVFVVDEDEHLRGMASLQELLQADPGAGVADLMTKDVVTVQVDDHVEEVAAVLAKYNLVAVPVIDQEFRLQGTVTVDDALDAVLPEAVKRKLPRTL